MHTFRIIYCLIYRFHIIYCCVCNSHHDWSTQNASIATESDGSQHMTNCGMTCKCSGAPPTPLYLDEFKDETPQMTRFVMLY